MFGQRLKTYFFRTVMNDELHHPTPLWCTLWFWRRVMTWLGYLLIRTSVQFVPVHLRHVFHEVLRLPWWTSILCGNLLSDRRRPSCRQIEPLLTSRQATASTSTAQRTNPYKEAYPVISDLRQPRFKCTDIRRVNRLLIQHVHISPSCHVIREKIK